MMRVAERPLAQQAAAAQPAGNGLDHAQLQRLSRLERRQDARQSRRQHRFPGTGWADQQQVVAGGGGDLQRPLGGLLTLDVAQVEAGGTRRRSLGSGGGNNCEPLKWLTIASSEGAAMTSTSPAQAASPPQSAGQMMPLS